MSAARLAALVSLVAVCGCGPSAPPDVRVERADPTAAAANARTAPGGRVHARFTVTNAGGRDLVVNGIVRDCDCEVASAVPDAIAPGAQVTVDVACRAPRNAAQVVREMRLFTDDPTDPIEYLRVPITAEPAPVKPAAVYLGYVAVGASASREVTVDASRSGATTTPVASNHAITVTAKADTSGAGRAFVLRFTPTHPGVVHATVDLGGGATVAVSGVGFRGVLAYPAEVRLPSETTAGGPPAIALKGVGEEPLEITRVEFPPGLAGDLQPTTPGHEYRLALRTRGSAAWITSDAAIRIHTASTTDPVVTIPVVHEARS